MYNRSKLCCFYKNILGFPPLSPLGPNANVLVPSSIVGKPAQPSCSFENKPTIAYVMIASDIFF